MDKKQIPDIAISRLPGYLQVLEQMAREGFGVVSSLQLGKRLNISPAQIRKDFSHFGEFGQQGKGYPLFSLMDQLQQILHIDRIWQVVLVGAGDLGCALGNYQGFRMRGFDIVKIYDNDPMKIGKKTGALTIEDVNQMPEDVKKLQIKLGILTVTQLSAQQVADVMMAAGIRAILNYTGVNLQVTAPVHVQNIDPVMQLLHMTYYLADD